MTLLGRPVAHSRSPRIHNAAFRAQGLNYVYVAADVAPDDLPAAVAGLRALGYAGANVTRPHKQAVRSLVDESSERAEAVGAVNAIVCRGEKDGLRLVGDNTDVEGFLAPLAPHAEALRGGEMLVFGAGGAARAVCYALLTAHAPARLTLAARRPAQAEALAAHFAAYDARGALRVVPLAEAGPPLRRAALVVNATPLGMHPQAEGTPWPRREDFSGEQIAYDLVYNPLSTRFLKDAALREATPLGGLEMLIGQAAAAYRQWTGRAMPLAAVRRALSSDDGS